MPAYCNYALSKIGVSSKCDDLNTNRYWSINVIISILSQLCYSYLNDKPNRLSCCISGQNFEVDSIFA